MARSRLQALLQDVKHFLNISWNHVLAQFRAALQPKSSCGDTPSDRYHTRHVIIGGGCIGELQDSALRYGLVRAQDASEVFVLFLPASPRPIPPVATPKPGRRVWMLLSRRQVCPCYVNGQSLS